MLSAAFLVSVMLSWVSENKFRKNRRPRKGHPAWLLLLCANMFTYRKNKNYWGPIGCRVDK
uniref:Uncharacterized protein n=1 Tax=Candidatus Kentrum sp. UNK TaxID=2126344 RepID=A0A451AHE5_9GAMM|nr:MAG: hypothetical protein BECKUNK1418G_GA0071005_10635 [Candidatus Kentron sp. UNK]VFK73244.1 MAG: hypothetical protein BECKUNK1418H_GA0071006_11781 [Candidatus Kentron sp. UNK]